jgi:hypothetical protein
LKLAAEAIAASTTMEITTVVVKPNLENKMSGLEATQINAFVLQIYYSSCKRTPGKLNGSLLS